MIYGKQYERTRLALGTPPRVPEWSNHRDKDAVKGRKAMAWLAAIESDRNYARLLFNLPLNEPVCPAFRRWSEGWIQRNSRQAKPDDL